MGDTNVANDDEDFLQYVQEIQQFYVVLTVTMLSAEKRYKKKDGNFRLFGSPRPRDMEDDDDESGDEHWLQWSNRHPNGWWDNVFDVGPDKNNISSS